MVTKDRLGRRMPIKSAHGGRNEMLVYEFFQGEMDGLMQFGDLVLGPGEYTGYQWRFLGIP